jgi:hypothetical protein
LVDFQVGLEEKLDAHINVDIQFNLEDMKNYCSKETPFISEEYSGKIYKHQWQMDFLERKPQLKKVLKDPFEWQKFLKEQIIEKKPDDRTVDWIIDPVGNTGKSCFARAYVSQVTTDGILMKMDNLDRMELTLIKKIEEYRKLFRDALIDHMKSVKPKDGTFHGDPVIHYLDETTGLNVMINLETKKFISGWKLEDDQVKNILNRGSL